jgi:hypothetical protein
MSRKFGLLAALVLVLSATQPRASLILDNPCDLTTAGVVGIKTGLAGEGANETNRKIWAQQILDLALAGTLNPLSPPDNGHSWEYEANTVYDYAGTLTTGDPTQTSFTISGDQVVIPAGYAYVLIKYDGPNAGYVLFKTGGGASLLPQYPWNIWGNTNNAGLAISGWTGYYALTPNPGTEEVPEPASVAVWALLSLCCGGFASKMRRRQK